MSPCQSATIVRSYKAVYPDECKQLRKHHEPLTNAKHKPCCFPTSEIKNSCNTELQAFTIQIMRGT